MSGGCLRRELSSGTGGAGPTILETTFLLAGEPTVAYKDGKEYVLPPVSERRCVDFGPGLRKRDVWLYNLPEVKSSFKVCTSLFFDVRITT